jgi:hypothetical protein
MESVSDADINQEYEIRRLQGLRQLAHEVNDKMQHNPQLTIFEGQPVENPYIENVDNQTADYLWFSIYERSALFPINLAQQLGYGYYYDALFRSYSNVYASTFRLPLSFEINGNLPYVLLSNPQKLKKMYPLIYQKSRPDIMAALENLKDGTGRDLKIDSLLSKFSDPTRSTAIPRRDIIDMMENEEFDILDSIYILLYVTRNQDAADIRNRYVYSL